MIISRNMFESEDIIDINSLHEIPVQFWTAKEFALESVFSRGKRNPLQRLGAALFDKKNFMFGGMNYLSNKTHPESGNAYSQHAEFNCLSKAKNCLFKRSGFDADKVERKLRYCSLYVCRISASGMDFMMARPCFNCMEHILNTGIKNVYYTISNIQYGVIKI